MTKIMVSLLISGLLFASGPCLASCGPVLISYIAGTKKNAPQGLFTYILFSLARIFVYVILGLLVFFLGKFSVERLSGAFSRYIFIFGGSFIIVIGILVALGRRLEFKPWRGKNIILIGFIIGLVPCAPFLAVLSYIGLIAKTWLESLWYSLAFGLGTLVSPLILFTLLAGLIPQRLLNNNYSRAFSFICGLIIILLGIRLVMRAF